MVKDIFSMTQAEFAEKVKKQHLNIKEENAKYGLPTTGYSETLHCVVDTYFDGKTEKVDVNAVKLSIPKKQHYSS
jgi:hypothetical protein